MAPGVLTPLLASLVLACAACSRQEARAGEGPVQILDARVWHLGDDPTPEWDEAPEEPDGTRLDLSFVPGHLGGEQVLLVEHRHVDDPWHLELNGERIATLRRGAERREEAYVVPAGVLRRGENRLALVPEVPSDDITVGPIRLVASPLRKVLGLRPALVRVRDAGSGAALPARVTVTRAGALVPLYYAESLHTAVRPGVVYTARGEARFEVPAGDYDVYATRGAEWGLGRGRLVVSAEGGTLDLALGREVDTRGFVACDTHIHTLTFSGHGDALLEERVVTLAGEGVELAIATDHNHNTEYGPTQERAGLAELFTSVVGNEVTTELGHFNAFPLDPSDAVPDHELTDPVALVADMRAHGAEVVILNHPRWPNHAEGPFGVAGLDRFTGRRALAYPLTFDATELVNSDTAEDDPLFLFHDWFALLNNGERIVAVGSSDSHTVGSPVGQGRTYVASSTDDPARIDVDEACANIKAGRSTIGMGIFCDLLLADGSRPGDLARASEGRIRGTLAVRAPSWVRPRVARVYVNGLERHALRWDDERAAGPFVHSVDFDLEWPHAHDAWVVCVVTGDGIEGSYWPSVNAYTLAATNPVWIDVDGDGRHSSPRAEASDLLARGGGEEAALAVSLAGCDDAVAIQLLALVRAARLAEVQDALERVAGERGSGSGPVAEYLRSLAR